MSSNERKLVCSPLVLCFWQNVLLLDRDLVLTHIKPLLHWYRNQLIDLQHKSIDWFLYGVV